jgi:hypothetical protein
MTPRSPDGANGRTGPRQAPELTAVVLLMWEDGCVMPWHPTHDVEASSSRAGLPAPDVAVACPEQE